MLCGGMPGHGKLEMGLSAPAQTQLGRNPKHTIPKPQPPGVGWAMRNKLAEELGIKTVQQVGGEGLRLGL
jgi:hypothetical protein